MLVSNLKRGSGKKHQNQIEEVSNKNKVNYSHKKPFQRYQPIAGWKELPSKRKSWQNKLLLFSELEGVYKANKRFW